MVDIEYYKNEWQIKTRSQLKKPFYCIPQGSILGLLLFSTYINSFPENLPQEHTCAMFADDTTISTQIPQHNQIHPQMEETIHKILHGNKFIYK